MIKMNTLQLNLVQNQNHIVLSLVLINQPTGGGLTERLRITSAGNFNFLGNLVNVNATGVSSFVQLDVSTGGIDVDGQATLDEVVVSGASTFTGTVKIDGALDIGVAGVDVETQTHLSDLRVLLHLVDLMKHPRALIVIQESLLQLPQ